MPQEIFTFGIWFNPKQLDGIKLQTATLMLDGVEYTKKVPPDSVLRPGPPGYHFSAYASIAYAWETTRWWQYFTTFDLTGLHMAQHSLGGVPPPKGLGPEWENYQIAGLVAHTNFKATTVTMDGLHFEPDDGNPDTGEEFARSLAAALSKATTITAVSLIGTTPSLATPSIETALCHQFPHITFTFVNG